VPFEGELKSVALESVLRNIDANNLTGTLTIRDDRGERKVAFIEGRIYAFLPIRGEEIPVPDALARKGLISKEEVEKVRTSLAFKRLNLKRALEYRGLVTEQDYAQAVRDEVIVPHVFELFTKRERAFHFDDRPFDGTPTYERDLWDADQLAAELRVLIEPVVLECMKRLDEVATRSSPEG
jgi:hypothetical protein